MRYRAQPVEIEAIMWRGQLADIPAHWDADAFDLDRDGEALIIQTLEGPARAIVGHHWVARGTAGEYYPIRVDVFATKYEEAA